MIRTTRKSTSTNGHHPKIAATVRAVLRNLICTKAKLRLAQRSWMSRLLWNLIGSLISARIRFPMSRKTTINLASIADLPQRSHLLRRNSQSLWTKRRAQHLKLRMTTRTSIWMKALIPSKIDFLVYLLVNNSNYNFTPQRQSAAHTNTSCP